MHCGHFILASGVDSWLNKEGVKLEGFRAVRAGGKDAGLRLDTGDDLWQWRKLGGAIGTEGFCGAERGDDGRAGWREIDGREEMHLAVTCATDDTVA